LISKQTVEESEHGRHPSEGRYGISDFHAQCSLPEDFSYLNRPEICGKNVWPLRHFVITAPIRSQVNVCLFFPGSSFLPRDNGSSEEQAVQLMSNETWTYELIWRLSST
jgi:hypothetical protein